METATSYQKTRERQQEARAEERIKEHFEQASATRDDGQTPYVDFHTIS